MIVATKKRERLFLILLLFFCGKELGNWEKEGPEGQGRGWVWCYPADLAGQRGWCCRRKKNGLRNHEEREFDV